MPGGIAVYNLTNVFVSDTRNHTIRKITFDGAAWATSTIAGVAASPGSSDGTNTDARFNRPGPLTVDRDGSLYVADAGNHMVRKIAPSGTNWVVTTIAGSPGLAGSADGPSARARFNAPQGLAIGPTSTLFVGDYYNGTIRMLEQIGTDLVVQTVIGRPDALRANGANSFGRLCRPSNLALNRDGSLFIADTLNHAIRNLAHVGNDWVLSTVAGQLGVPGSKDGTNGDARFTWPAGVAIDADGNLFVADKLNSTIRKITFTGTQGVVSTLAGTAGVLGCNDGTNTDARFSYPSGIAVGRDQNLYIADSSNGTIRRMALDGTNWIVTTLAGGAYTGTSDGTNSSARFFIPTDLAVDDFTNIFVTDYAGGAIRKITPIGKDWVVTTIAGSFGSSGSSDGEGANARFNGPTGIALDREGSLWISDSGNQTLRKLVPRGTNWMVTTVAGSAGLPGAADGYGASAGFRMPGGIAVDSALNLYIADTGNDTIRFGQPVPSLQIISVDGRPILSWSASASNFALESGLLAPDGSSWVPIVEGVTATPSGFFFTNNEVSSPLFYRLRKQCSPR